MPNSILALAQEPQINIARAAFEPGYATCLVNTREFTIRRRGTWLVVRDNLERKSYAFRLNLDPCPRKKGNAIQARYRLKTRQLMAFHSLWKTLKQAGLFVGNKTAESGKGKLYLDRVIAAVAGLHERDGFTSLSWVRHRRKALNHVVHHIDGDTTNDQVTNLRVMLESQHDDLHDVLDLRAAWLVPVATKLKPSEVAPKERACSAFARVSAWVAKQILQPYEELLRPRSGYEKDPDAANQGEDQGRITEYENTLVQRHKAFSLTHPSRRASYQVLSRLSSVGTYQENSRNSQSICRTGSPLRGPPMLSPCSGLQGSL